LAKHEEHHVFVVMNKPVAGFAPDGQSSDYVARFFGIADAECTPGSSTRIICLFP
jgi:hypothetical protein